MINKKNLWFLTLFSLVLVLSIYYVTMPNEIFDKNIKETTTDNSTTKVEETSIISALKVEDDNNVMDKINSLKEKLTSTDYDFIDNLFLNLTDCKICGKISVYESSCLVCNENLEEILKNQRNQSWKRYNNIEEIIKKEQENFQYNTKHIITIKYRFQNDISFEKYLDFVDLKTKK